jgi:DNA-binding YbaB/EbfC family protein
MFKEIGQIAGLMKQLPKLQQEMELAHQRLGQVTTEGDAGAGMVKVKANGNLVVLSCTISEEALRLDDREVLEDLIIAAVNQAITKARQLAAEETGKMVSGLGFPPGILSGLQGPVS